MSATPLSKIIASEIEAGGPMTIARYMELALGHPVHGYYMGPEPFGTAGDFITAPEISQMFGELLGLWCADMWQKLDRPRSVILAELGPGRGTLMADALRAAAVMPGFVQSVQVHLVETSPVLRQRQQDTLKTCGRTIHWHDRIDDLPAGPLLLIANELFDALPAHQFECRGGVWHERCISLGPDGALTIGLTPAPSASGLVPSDFVSAPDSAVFELAPQRNRLAAKIAAHLVSHKGAAIIIDYGHEKPGLGDTFQALHHHTYRDPLDDPGQADITTHVDFSALAEAATAAGAKVHGISPMGGFLDAMGLQARATRLKSGASEETRKAINSAVTRLTGPGQMGSLFKVLTLSGPSDPPPAPFA